MNRKLLKLQVCPTDNLPSIYIGHLGNLLSTCSFTGPQFDSCAHLLSFFTFLVLLAPDAPCPAMKPEAIKQILMYKNFRLSADFDDPLLFSTAIAHEEMKSTAQCLSPPVRVAFLDLLLHPRNHINCQLVSHLAFNPTFRNKLSSTAVPLQGS